MDRQSTMVIAAWVTVAANVTWLCAVAYLHLVERELHPASRYISEYVLTRSGWVMEVAFAVMTVGALSLALGFALTGWRGLPIALALVAYGVAMGIAGWFPTDSSVGSGGLTADGALHNQAARWVYLSIVGAAFLGAAYGLLRVHPFDDGTGLAGLWVIASGAVIVAYIFTNYGWRLLGPGTLQRIFLASVLAWLTLAALRLATSRGG